MKPEQCKKLDDVVFPAINKDLGIRHMMAQIRQTSWS
jgi:hypothetical protein